MTTTQYVDDIADTTEALVREGKQIAVKSVENAMATVHEVVPEVAQALSAVDPRGLVDTAFGAAGMLLDSQRSLVREVLGAVFDKPAQDTPAA